MGTIIIRRMPLVYCGKDKTEVQQAWRIENPYTPEEHKEYMQKYRQEHKEQANERAKIYREANRDKINEKKRLKRLEAKEAKKLI